MKDKIIEILKDNELLRTDGVHTVMIKGIFPEVYESLANQIQAESKEEAEERLEQATVDYINEQFVGLDPEVWAGEIKVAKSHFIQGFKAAFGKEGEG